MSGINSKNTRGNSSRNERNNPTSHPTHQQTFGNKALESKDLDDLMCKQAVSQVSFALLNIDDTPRQPQIGLEYDSRFTTANNDSTGIESMSTERSVPACQDRSATDTLLQQQNNNRSSLNSESSGETPGPTIIETDIDEISYNSSEQSRFIGTDTHTNSEQQPDITSKVQDHDFVPLVDNVNEVLMPTDTQSSGVTAEHALLANGDFGTGQQQDDQQRHRKENYSGFYAHEYVDDHDDDDEYERPIEFRQSEVEEDVFDFGLCDSDDDEYIQASVVYQQYQQYSYHTMMPHRYPAIHDQLQYNQYHTSNPYQQKSKYHWYEDSPSGQLRRIDRRIQLFISDPSRETYQLPGMSTYCRRQVQGLATLYKLKMAHEDLGNNKIGPLLKKGPKTQLPTERRAIEKHINKIRTLEKAKKQMERRPGGAASEILNRTRKEERQRRKGLFASDLAPKSGMTTLPPSDLASKSTKKLAKQSNTRIVGSEAAPLTSNNIGHKIMASMGWKEGDALGVNNDGIANPIQPVIRTNRRGLGA